MSDRLLRVNAYTTLDLVEGRARGHEFVAEAPGVVNVTAPRENPDHVALEVELDNTAIDDLTAHADEIDLSPAQARTLADALESTADRVEAAQGGDDSS
ncbi:hypothetical protein C463_15735 [Halorubrum californiense DSM 19288]|uniref:Uncharacterized protein n=1 Tax=Halorubrum californiense DSM 19288 TaxID=1227465 RepID=M0E210_9EURY|nr:MULTISPECIES: DUF6360 family protein [Halorubrum]ELZ40384.1 hypothetical protein C463_15735 [Halorubrum californiense DSM 19288]TKX71894.1 hypothetical protein EXE46_16260 [Halorubrum sp. GN11_10-6_MGM]TKX73304.1 hypothetical protein EXE40_00835 [Halorubrum sp. GN11GM_10-3_MGM]